MELTFKSAIEQDSKEVFLNTLEFADSHTINGNKIPAIVDDNELLERDKAHLLNADISGLYYSRRLLYVAASDFGSRPVPDSFCSLIPPCIASSPQPRKPEFMLLKSRR